MIIAITDKKTAPSFLNIRQISASLISECTESIGEGSFGVCKKAFLQGIPVCVKELRERGSYGRELLLHEASVLSKLSHESVCFMFGIQNDRVPYCLVLNLYTVDGISITVHDLICVSGWIHTSEQDLTSKQRVLKHHYATLDNTAWLQIMKKVIGALNHVHGLGIIHRDLKADNVVFYCNSNFL